MENEKKLLRKQFLEKRKSLKKEYVENISFLVCQNIDNFLKDKFISIMSYIPINNEIDTLPLIKKYYEKNKIICFPKVCGDKIKPYVINDLYNDLKKGAFNIPEPDTSEYLKPIDCILIPGIVFGLNGYRIGYGKGFYDHFLNSLPYRPLKVGIAFDFQIVNSVPHTSEDSKLDYIITEKNVYKLENV